MGQRRGNVVMPGDRNPLFIRHILDTSFCDGNGGQSRNEASSSVTWNTASVATLLRAGVENAAVQVLDPTPTIMAERRTSIPPVGAAARQCLERGL